MDEHRSCRYDPSSTDGAVRVLVGSGVHRSSTPIPRHAEKIRAIDASRPAIRHAANQDAGMVGSCYDASCRNAAWE